ncbi:MAG: hypothetical protein ACOX1F_02445 [Erysipelotrichaceae bacterium]|jgi:uncharacterized protein YacL
MAKKQEFVATKSAGQGPRKTTKEERRQGASGKRIAAVIFWLIAFAFEVVAILVVNKTIFIKPFTSDYMLYTLIALLVLDLIFVIIGSQFWKRANDIDPVSEKNKLKFFLWNQMGLIVSVICFFPFILLLLNNKEMDAKTKKIVTAVATVAMLISGVASADWNPMSEEERIALEEEITAEVYYTTFGRKYHTHSDCQAIVNSKTIYHGPIADALDAGRTELCKFCAARDGKVQE